MFFLLCISNDERPLLFIVVMEEATNECRVGNPWELLYADFSIGSAPVLFPFL